MIISKDMSQTPYIRISTKRSQIKKISPQLAQWLNKNGPTAALIDWYLQDAESREWLQTYCDRLDQEYIKELDGDVRIKWNHLDGLLNSHGMIDEIKEKFFQSFLYTGSRSIKKLIFCRKEDGSFVPVSLV